MTYYDPEGALYRGAWVIIMFIAAFTLAMMAAAKSETGMASYYSHGQKTANGERFHPNAMTCAHKTRPFNSTITVRWGHRSIRCRVNDRGPFVRGRIVDLSFGAAIALGMTAYGVVPVTIED